jgi:predicted dehydrogenase/threonine dehydrogenase-like Zn-dependent dehydrogenase
LKILAQTLKNGDVIVLEAPAPDLAPGCVRVRTLHSAISPGTEGTKIVTGRMSLIGKARAKPDQVKQVIEMAGQLGVKNTIRKVRDKLEGAQPLGYSTCGEVTGLGEGVDRFAIGDLVSCAGGGYANHADEVVVPVNLVVKVPEGVPAEAAAMTTIGAIALQGVRMAAPTLGENAVVVGLGAIGLMACQLLKANGCRVFAADIDGAAARRAVALGVADQAGQLGTDPVEEMIQTFSRGPGADLVLICAGTSSSEPVQMAGRITRQRGRVVVVGAVGMDLPRPNYYEKELSFAVSCSYGPGRYDPTYEEGGLDYPYGFVRWTEGRNMEAVLDLMAAGSLDPLPLVTHRFAFDDAPQAYAMIADRSEPFCGILLDYPREEKPTPSILALGSAAAAGDHVGVGFIGAGNFAQTFLLPPLKGHARVDFTNIFTRTGMTAADVGKRYGFANAVDSPQGVLQDEATAAVVVATRHDQHGPLVLAALEAGKHVFVEKPLCLTEAQLVAIRDRASAMSADGQLPVVLTGFNRRFSGSAQAVRKHFGRDPGALSMTYRVAAGRIPGTHWTQDPIEGGGRIMGEVCHFIDLMQFVCGGMPVEVSATALETPNTDITAADNVSINIRFSDGSVGNVCYFAEAAKTVPKERLEVHGAGRSAVLDNFSSVTLYAGRSKKTRRIAGKGHPEEMKAFIDGVRRGESPISLESQIYTTLATLRVLESLRDRSVLTVDPADLGRGA